MSSEIDPAALPRSERVEAAYRAHYDVLRFIAAKRFRVPDDDVRGLIHDVFLAFIRAQQKIRPTPSDERAWLVGAVCNACRYYWRKRRHEGPPDELEQAIDPTAVAEDAINRVVLANVLRGLPERCRDLLRRRYGEGYTPQEIAAWQSLKLGSAKNLISKCLVAARAAFRELLRRTV